MEHDLLCPQHYVQVGLRDAAGNRSPQSCQCNLIADVGERIAEAIKAMPPENVWAYNGEVVLRSDAARIARNVGKLDE